MLPTSLSSFLGLWRIRRAPRKGRRHNDRLALFRKKTCATTCAIEELKDIVEQTTFGGKDPDDVVLVDKEVAMGAEEAA